MTIDIYLFLAFFYNICILLFCKIKQRDFFVFVFLILLFLSFSFCSNYINDDAINYSFYFNKVYDFPNFFDLFHAKDFAKVEIGFKLFLYIVSKINIIQETFVFRFFLMLVNILTFFYIKKYNKIFFYIFAFFYTSFFILTYNLALIRLSLAISLFLLAYINLVRLDRKKNSLIFFVLGSSVHLAVFFFSIIFILFYLIFKKIKQQNALYILMFISVVLCRPLFIAMSKYFGDYYIGLWYSANVTLSLRVIFEIILIFYFTKKYSSSDKQIFSLIFIIYIFFALVECFYGIHVLNRMRIIAWLIFCYELSNNWMFIKKTDKLIMYFYSFSFFLFSLYGMYVSWH